jgi:methylmalonyl-CoA mutase cobalamin-binding subunit
LKKLNYQSRKRKIITAGEKAALAAAKARGVRVGNPDLRHGTREQALAANRVSAKVISDKSRRYTTDMAPVISSIKAGGATSLAKIVAALNARGIPRRNSRGGWHAATAQRVLVRSTA